jgi:chemotaxis signal transduction protein
MKQLEPASCWHKIGVYGDGSCPELARFIHCRNCPVYSEASLQLLDRPLPAEYRREWTAHFSREKQLPLPARTSALLFRLAAEWLALPTYAFQEVAERRPIHSLPHRRQGPVLGLVNIRGELLICVALARLLGLERTPGPPKRGASVEPACDVAAGVSPAVEPGVPPGGVMARIPRPPVPRGSDPSGVVPPSTSDQAPAASPERSAGLQRRLTGASTHLLLVVNWDGQRLAFPVDEVHGLHRFDAQDLKDLPATVAKSSLNFTQGLLMWRQRAVGVLDPQLLFSALIRSVM